MRMRPGITLLRTAALALILLLANSAQAGGGGQDMENDRYARGWKTLAALDAEGASRVQDSLKDIAPDMGRFIIEFGYGDLYDRPALTPKSRQTAIVAALAALGNAQPQLRFHMGAGLSAGLTPDEIVEIIYVTTVFAGFPAGLNALATAREVFAARAVAVTPVPPEQAYASPDRRTRGLASLESTSQGAGQRVLDSLAGIAPDMAAFILDFSYGDVISRRILDPRLKEIVMIAASVARGTMQPQLKVHIRAALNVGLSREEIVEVIVQMCGYAGFPASLNGLSAAREAFAEG